MAIVEFPEVIVTRSLRVRVLTFDALGWVRWNSAFNIDKPGTYELPLELIPLMVEDGIRVHWESPAASRRRSRQSPLKRQAPSISVPALQTP